MFKHLNLNFKSWSIIIPSYLAVTVTTPHSSPERKKIDCGKDFSSHHMRWYLKQFSSFRRWFFSAHFSSFYIFCSYFQHFAYICTFIISLCWFYCYQKAWQWCVCRQVCKKREKKTFVGFGESFAFVRILSNSLFKYLLSGCSAVIFCSNMAIFVHANYYINSIIWNIRFW